MNISFVVKLDWKMKTQENYYWVQILKEKYQQSIEPYQEYKQFSPIFELLFSASFFMNSHFNFIPGNEVTIRILEYFILHHISLENVEEL